MVLGGGSIADLIEREQRGTAMSVWLMGPSKAFQLCLKVNANVLGSNRAMYRACHGRFSYHC